MRGHMARRRYVQIDGELIEVGDDYIPEPRSPMIYGDIQPYQSMVDGRMINSRSDHRAHLRYHGLTEVGNETKYLKSKAPAPPPGLKDTLIRVVNDKWRR